MVGIIGKTQLGKGELVNGLGEAALCPIGHEGLADEGSGLEVRVVHQPRQRRILLGLSGPFDANAMLASVERARGAGAGLAATLADQDFEHVKAMLYVFHVAHVVLVASEGPRVDLQLLRALSVLQSAKRSLGSSLVNALGVSGRGASSEPRALTAGCVVPSLVFVFRVSPGAPFSRRNCEKLQGSLDKQLAYLMRKLRLPEGKGPEPLFCLSKEAGTACVVSAPPTDDIVGVFDGLFSGTFDRVGGRGGGVGEGGIDANSPGMQPLVEMVGTLVAELVAASSAATEASDAAPKKPPSSSGNRKSRRVVPTLLPSASAWFLHACALHDLFRFPSEGRSGAYAKTAAALSRPRLGALSDVSWQYSTVTCERAMPIARAAYTKGLPELYTRRRHLSQLQQVLRVFRQTAVGPACPRYQEILEKECEAIWTAGRQMCDTVSLTGQPCTLPRHDSSVAHTSGVSMPRACDCGTSVEICSDAFELDDANTVCRPCCTAYSSLALPQCDWKLHRLGDVDHYQYDDSKPGGPERGGLEQLPGFLSGRGQLFPWLTNATVQLRAMTAANTPAPATVAGTAAEPGKRSKEKQGKDGFEKDGKAEDTAENEWPTLEAFPTLGETVANPQKGHQEEHSEDLEDEDAEKEEDEEQLSEQREPQVLQLEHGLGAWLIAARRIALSANGTENDDEIALRAGGAQHETAAQRPIGSHRSLGVSVVASEDRANITDGHTVGGGRGMPIPNAPEALGGSGEWAGSVAIGKRAADQAAAAAAAAEDGQIGSVTTGNRGSKGGKGVGSKRGKKGKVEKDETVVAPTPAAAPEFDSQGRPIIRVGPDGKLMMPPSPMLQADSIGAGGNSKTTSRSKQQRHKQKESAAKSGAAAEQKEETEEEEQGLVRVGFEYECSSCGCRMIADEGVDVAATAAAQHRDRNRLHKKKKDRSAAQRDRATSPPAEDQEEEQDKHGDGDEEGEAELEQEEEELTAEKRRPLGLVDSMPFLLKCCGGGSSAKVGHQDPGQLDRNSRCRKYAQLRRIFFTTPAVCAPLVTPNGHPSGDAGTGGDDFDMEKVAPRPPRTAGGEAVDHASVAAWRCKLRLKASSLTDAYLVVGGNPVPALDFLQNDMSVHKANGSTTGTAAGLVLDKAGRHSYERGAFEKTAAGIVDGHGIDLFEDVEVVLPAGTYFVLRLPSVPLLCGQPLLVGPLAKELRVDSEHAKGASGLDANAKRDSRGDRGGANGGKNKLKKGQQPHAGLRLMLGEFLRPVGGKEAEEQHSEGKEPK